MTDMLRESDSSLLAARLYSLIVDPGDGGDEPASADTRLMLLDAIGVALAAWREATPALMRESVVTECHRASAGKSRATIWGSDFTGNCFDVALANGVAAHALDYDPLIPSAYVQPAAVLVPALIALAEQFECLPSRVTVALARGLRLLTLLGRQWGGRLHSLGWHPSTVLGPVAAAAAACYLCGLEMATAVHALGMTASLSSGVKVNFGTAAKHIQVGEAARRAVLATVLASNNATANPRALEVWLGQLLGGPVGSDLPEFAPEVDLQVKKYPSCGRMHAAIDACLALGSSVQAQSVDSIEIELSPADVGHISREDIVSVDEARFSIQYCAAVAILDYELTLQQFSYERIKSNDVKQLMSQITTVVNPSIPSFGARVRIRHGSSSDQKYVPRPQPATEDEVMRKFLACCAVAGIGEKVSAELSGAIMHLSDAPTMAEFSSYLRRAKVGAAV